MQVYDIIIAVQIIEIVALGIVLFFALTDTNSEYKNMLIMTAGCSFIGAIGYYLCLSSNQEAALLLAGKITYLGKGFAVFFALLFVAKYYKISVSSWFWNVLFAVNQAAVILVFTSDFHDLYYRNTQMLQNGWFHYLKSSPGICYYIYVIFQAGQVIALEGICIYQWEKEIRRKSRVKSNRYLKFGFVISGIVPILSLIVTLLPISKGYDAVILGMSVSCIMLYVTIKIFGIDNFVPGAMESFIENAPEGVLVADQDYKILYANEVGKVLIEDKDAAGIGTLEELFNRNNKLLSIGKSTYQITTHTITSNGKECGYMLWFSDMTELFAQTEHVMELRERAEAADIAKSEFVEKMSHEFRTPMNAIIGLAQMTKNGDVGEKERENIIQIQRAAELLQTLLGDILDFSDLEKGKVPLKKNSYYVDQLLQDMDTMFRGKAREKGLQLFLKKGQEVSQELYGDSIRIRQIMFHLLSNGIKFTKTGYVKLELSGRKTGEGNQERLILQMTVEDTGMGIDNQEQASIFKRFENAKSHKKNAIDGRGVGLTIVQQLVELMDGSIGVSSICGEGSIFTVEIPQEIVKRKRTESADFVMQVPFYAPMAKILVVDDNKVNQKVAEGLLSKFHIMTLITDNGADAVKLVEKENIDLILMDYIMPDLNGVETMNLIRKLPDRKKANVPIIALTANLVGENGAMMVKAGMDDFLVKPIVLQQLTEKLLKWLPKDFLQLI